MKIYVIDESIDLENSEFRFRSLMANVFGKWYEDKEKAIAEAEQHQAIMERLYPQLRDREVGDGVDGLIEKRTRKTSVNEEDKFGPVGF